MELPENRVHFFSGTPEQTGTSTLTITLTDVNDNAPYFVENFNFRVGATTQEGEVVGMTFCQYITRFKRLNNHFKAVFRLVQFFEQLFENKAKNVDLFTFKDFRTG